jgi:hypothetical protein
MNVLRGIGRVLLAIGKGLLYLFLLIGWVLLFLQMAGHGPGRRRQY